MKVPDQHEYNPYFERYIHLALAKKRMFPELLDQNTIDTVRFFQSIPIHKQDYRYAANKWTVKEILLHLTDTERVFAYRALVCVRGDAITPLHSMNENLYAANASVSLRTMESLLEEFIVVRQNTAFILKNTTEEQSRFLSENEGFKISARALCYIMVGHISHHIEVLHQKYL